MLRSHTYSNNMKIQLTKHTVWVLGNFEARNLVAYNRTKDGSINSKIFTKDINKLDKILNIACCNDGIITGHL